MPKFDAGTAPEALDYDFSAWGVDAKGTVPEPTQGALGAFLDFYETLTQENKQAQQKADEAALQARANAMQAEQDAAPKEENIVIVGELPADLPVPEKPADEPAEDEPENRSWREIILGDDKKAREFADQIGVLCQNQPSGDQIWALPPRIRGAFIVMALNVFVFGDESGGLKPSGTSS